MAYRRLEGVIHLEREFSLSGALPQDAVAKVVRDGTMKVDAATMLDGVDLLQQQIPVDRQGRITLGLNCLIIKVGGKNVLIDTGVGNTCPRKIKEDGEGREVRGGRLLGRLNSIGLTPEDIDIVILTQLPFDHAAGCITKDQAGRVVPVFSRAVHYVRRQCWEEATHQDPVPDAFYHMKYLVDIFDRGRAQLRLLDGKDEEEIIPGVRSIASNGHCLGHQIISVTIGNARILFTGELFPTHIHLELECGSKFDRFPDHTREHQREMLKRVESEGSLLVFSHGLGLCVGYLERSDGQLRVRAISNGHQSFNGFKVENPRSNVGYVWSEPELNEFRRYRAQVIRRIVRKFERELEDELGETLEETWHMGYGAGTEIARYERGYPQEIRKPKTVGLAQAARDNAISLETLRGWVARGIIKRIPSTYKRPILVDQYEVKHVVEYYKAHGGRRGARIFDMRY